MLLITGRKEAEVAYLACNMQSQCITELSLVLESPLLDVDNKDTTISFLQ